MNKSFTGTTNVNHTCQKPPPFTPRSLLSHLPKRLSKRLHNDVQWRCDSQLRCKGPSQKGLQSRFTTKTTRMVQSGAASSPSQPSSNPKDTGEGTVFKGVSWGAGVLILVAAAWALAHNAGYAPLLKEWAANSALGKSGFLAAFTLIFLSEIGDKTFFLAGLLAMKVGRAISFVGSTLALALMTVISVLIGYGFKSVPDALKSSVPIGRYLSVACMFYFGVRTLQEAWQTPKEADNEGGEFASAQLSLDEAEKGGGLKTQTAWQALLQVGSIIFLAEWGDRSMLATVALGVSHSPLGVAVGAILGHGLATLLAVTGGALASQYVSEKTLGLIGGTLFLVFATATLFGAF